MNAQKLAKLTALGLAQPIAVVGMGISGQAVLQALLSAGYEAKGVDEKRSTQSILSLNLDVAGALAEFKTLIVSPGVDRRRQALSSVAKEVAVFNDVELFARLLDKPVLAVTGSNGKSTVVTLLYEALGALGYKAVLCGNIGRAVIEAFFSDEAVDYYVLELSSYQLELCPSLSPLVGVIVNVTPDHLDRYEDFSAYAEAKGNLARQAQHLVLNAEDAYCVALSKTLDKPIEWFSLQKTSQGGGVHEGMLLLEGEAILPVADLALKGKHNYANVLCVLLSLRALGLPFLEALGAICTFSGLAHRMQQVATTDGVVWIDDSKATNVGATVAALAGVSAPLILILGGAGKGQDFSELAQAVVEAKVKQVLLIGVDNRALQAALKEKAVAFVECQTLDMAVSRARDDAQAGDWVLLSPACASLDQFKNYQQRGLYFAQLAQGGGVDV